MGEVIGDHVHYLTDPQSTATLILGDAPLPRVDTVMSYAAVESDELASEIGVGHGPPSIGRALSQRRIIPWEDLLTAGGEPLPAR